MEKCAPVIAAIVVFGLTSTFASGDWPQWRGPDRNGIARDSTALIDSFPKEGPKLVWKSGRIPGGAMGGYGSVSVAGGFAYVYSNSKYREPLATRTLTAKALAAQLGWSADMPEALRDKVEQARVSDERAKVSRKELRQWLGDWRKKNLTKKDRKFWSICSRRLTEAAKAIPIEALKKLDQVKDKAFPSQKALDEWFAKSGIEKKWRARILKSIPDHTPLARDEVYCVDCSDGAVKWKARFDGRHYQYSCSSTPCVADGRVYLEGSSATVYCLDAKTGDKVWQGKSKARASKQTGCSPVVQDGVLVLLSGRLMGFDAKTGKELWTHKKAGGAFSSPAYWRTGAKTRLVCNAGRWTFCVEAKTGNELWRVRGGGNSTPVIVGDRMVVFTGNRSLGIVAYDLSQTPPKQLWKFALSDRGSSPIVNAGNVYAFGGRQKARAVCLDLATGRPKWEQKLPNTEVHSPVLADGKLWAPVGSGKAWLYLVKATPRQYTLLAKANLKTVFCTSPAIVDGRMYLRHSQGLACYDLRK